MDTMSHHHHSHHLKRLQHHVNSNLHLSSQHTRENSSDHRSQLPNDEAMRESLQQFTISANNKPNSPSIRSFNPAPHRARRGGNNGRFRDRHGNSSLILPRRAINYDLAESFMDHSTNPLSSDLYKIKFTHSTKRWPNGRFQNYREKQDKLDGKIIEILCTRTFPIVTKRKKIVEVNQNEIVTPLLSIVDPIVAEEKRKQVHQQTNIYANLFGGGRIPKLSSAIRTAKSNPTTTTTSSSASSSASICLLAESTTADPPT